MECHVHVSKRSFAPVYINTLCVQGSSCKRFIDPPNAYIHVIVKVIFKCVCVNAFVTDTLFR